MWRVKRNEDKEAGKKKKEKEQEKIWNGFSKKKFGLCACTKVKFCTLLHEISIKMLLQCEKVL